MSANKIRDLLEAVADLGGPLELFAPHASDDERVGALKRDLIERGYRWGTIYDYDGYTAEVFTSDDKRFVPLVESEPHDSELEALLEAWLAAAEHEGWSA